MKRAFTKYVNSLDEKGLKRELRKLYERFDAVQQYYKLELGASTEKVLQEYKRRLDREYFPKRGHGRASNRESKRVISDFKKISIHDKDLVDLLLYRTELMIRFSAEYGDIDEPFYSSLENGFEQACKLIQREKLRAHFEETCKDLIEQTSGFGWGVYSTLSDIYEEYLD